MHAKPQTYLHKSQLSLKNFKDKWNLLLKKDEVIHKERKEQRQEEQGK